MKIIVNGFKNEISLKRKSNGEFIFKLNLAWYFSLFFIFLTFWLYLTLIIFSIWIDNKYKRNAVTFEFLNREIYPGKKRKGVIFDAGAEYGQI